MKISKIKNCALILIITSVFLFIIEGVASLIFYHKLKLPAWSVSSAVHLFVSSRALNKKFQYEVILEKTDIVVPSEDKLHAVLSERAEGIDAYPTYLFEPQYHHPDDPYFLANVPRSHLIYCNENGFFNNWVSDEIGFRNPMGQLNDPVDFIFIGDSFTVGACENEEGTLAGYFRSKGTTVANFGRAGTGPLFQLATLVEYGDLFRAKGVVWVVFTGNDLMNLTEEKTTLLQRYMDPDFNQSLYLRRSEIEARLTEFLEMQLEENKLRYDSGIPYPANHGYGEALDAYTAQKYESVLLADVAKRIYEVTKSQKKDLWIVILNHHDYNADFKTITSNTIKDFAEKNSVKYIEFSSDYLTVHRQFYTADGTHFNADGYRNIGAMIFDWLATGPVNSMEK